MRRSVLFDQFGDEMAASAPRGMTRRSFLIAGAATVGGIGAAAYVWHRYAEPLLESSGTTGQGIIRGEPLALTPSGMLLDTDFPDPCAGGEFLGYLPLSSQEEEKFPGRLYVNSGGGHDARLVIDVASLLTPEGRLTPSDQFFIRTEYPDLLKPHGEWMIKLHGHVKQPRNVPLSSLHDLVEPKGPVLLECSGNAPSLKFGLLSVADWAGIPIEQIVKLAQPTEKAKAILIAGFDDDSYLPDRGPPYRTHSYPTCSWVFPIQTLVDGGAFLATQMNGAPIPKNHGAPVRLIIPGWFGCTEVKWVNEIKFVDGNEKATWQMLEFSDRTHQETHEVPGFSHALGPTLARDYRPGTIDQNAIPVRVEQWKVAGKIRYRVVGITWGGNAGRRQRTEKFRIRFVFSGAASKFEPVLFCKAVTSNSQYGIWMHTFAARRKGYCRIQIRVDAPNVPSRRLSSGGWDRGVVIPAV
jgi:DMSO/TMAO reductase YedYZ molybdopterin-dependent catalytic subunit